MSVIPFFIGLIVNLNIFHTSVVFHIETNHLIWGANQTTGFYMKYSAGLKRVK